MRKKFVRFHGSQHIPAFLTNVSIKIVLALALFKIVLYFLLIGFEPIVIVVEVFVGIERLLIFVSVFLIKVFIKHVEIDFLGSSQHFLQFFIPYTLLESAGGRRRRLVATRLVLLICHVRNLA